jgi:hypothetical protein
VDTLLACSTEIEPEAAPTVASELVPDVLDREVHEHVAEAVRRAAQHEAAPG